MFRETSPEPKSRNMAGKSPARVSTDEFERFGCVNVPGLCANRVPASRACACVSSRARACPCASVSSVCASVSVVVRERVLPHVPLGALGVAVVWPGFSRHTPISTLPGASLVATAICLMRRRLQRLQRNEPRRLAARMRRCRGFSGAGSGG